MSVYTECSDATQKLIEDPPKDYGGVFTEIDVIRVAGTSGWSNTNYKEALRHASQIVGSLYRSRKLCRYGPVKLPDGEEDFARIASKIAYAPANSGPETWETPNGTFPKLMIEDDHIGRQGRRRMTNRNDLAPWKNQKDLRPERRAAANGAPVDIDDLRREVRRLDERLRRLEKVEEERAKIYAG